MIHELKQAEKLAVNEHRLVRRHGRMALSISLVHNLICLLFYFYGGGHFWASADQLALYFAVVWAGNLALAIPLFRGWTAHFRDPTLSLWTTVWQVGCFLVSAAFFVDQFRLSVVMLYFASMLLGSFRMRFRALLAVSIGASVGYLVVIWHAWHRYSMELSLSVEVLQWFIFTLAAFSFSVTGAGINALRNRLSRKSLELDRALARVRELAIRDELTGLFNRRHIMDVLHQQKALADSGDYRFVICYVDLDHFKRINDTCGHAIGDEVLKVFSERASAAIREADYTGRLGGEEFILVLTQTGLRESQQVAERLRSSLAQTDLSHLHKGMKITASIGVAEYRPGETLDETMARADSCLYRAKEDGRNRVVVDWDTAEAVPVPG